MYAQILTRSITKRLNDEDEHFNKKTQKSRKLEAYKAQDLDFISKPITKKKKNQVKQEDTNKRRKLPKKVDDAERVMEVFERLQVLSSKASQNGSSSIEAMNAITCNACSATCDLADKVERKLDYDSFPELIQVKIENSSVPASSIDMPLDESQKFEVMLNQDPNFNTDSWGNLNCNEDLPTSPVFDSTSLDFSSELWIDGVLNSLTFDQAHLLELERPLTDDPQSSSEVCLDSSLWLQNSPLAFNFSDLSLFNETARNHTEHNYCELLENQFSLVKHQDSVTNLYEE